MPKKKKATKKKATKKASSGKQPLKPNDVRHLFTEAQLKALDKAVSEALSSGVRLTAVKHIADYVDESLTIHWKIIDKAFAKSLKEVTKKELPKLLRKELLKKLPKLVDDWLKNVELN